jgi:hypothetical protein
MTPSLFQNENGDSSDRTNKVDLAQFEPEPEKKEQDPPDREAILLMINEGCPNTQGF